MLDANIISECQMGVEMIFRTKRKCGTIPKLKKIICLFMLDVFTYYELRLFSICEFVN